MCGAKIVDNEKQRMFELDNKRKELEEKLLEIEKERKEIKKQILVNESELLSLYNLQVIKDIHSFFNLNQGISHHNDYEEYDYQGESGFIYTSKKYNLEIGVDEDYISLIYNPYNEFNNIEDSPLEDYTRTEEFDTNSVTFEEIYKTFMSYYAEQINKFEQEKLKLEERISMFETSYRKIGQKSNYQLCGIDRRTNGKTNGNN